MAKPHNTQVNISFETKAKLEEVVKHYSNARSKVTMTFLLKSLVNEEHDRAFAKPKQELLA